MGENRASWESILGGSVWKEACCAIDGYLSFTQNTLYLRNICAEKLKYVPIEPLGCDNCKFNSAPRETLMIKSMNGEKKYAC
jgi:hypothetical protein